MSGAFILGAVGALLWLAVIIVLLRLSKRSPALIVVLTAALVYLAVLLAALTIFDRVAFWPFSATYGFLTLCVLMLFGALYKSVSLRMLGDLSKAAGWALPEQELLARYIEEDSFGRRVAILLNEGHAVRAPEGLVLSRKGQRIAAAIYRLQQAFAIRASG